MSENNYNSYSNNQNGYYGQDDNFDTPYVVDTTYFENTARSAKALASSFFLMAIALVVSAVTAIVVASSSIIASQSFTTLFYVAIFSEFIIVFAANSALRKDNASLAGMLFFVYSICTGFTFSIIFCVYDPMSIVMIFFTTAVMFAAIAIFATVTKKDLTVLGTIGYMGLIGIILVSIIYMIAGSSEPAIVTAIGLALFIGITAYDVQKIKSIANSGASMGTIAVFGALTLYLDFINIFLKLIRLFGRSRD